MCRFGVCCKCWGCVWPFNYINSAVLDLFAEAVSVPLKDKRAINIYFFPSPKLTFPWSPYYFIVSLLWLKCLPQMQRQQQVLRN